LRPSLSRLQHVLLKAWHAQPALGLRAPLALLVVSLARLQCAPLLALRSALVALAGYADLVSYLQLLLL